ncbi:MAG TPA: hypothetical protein VGW35_15850 [Methylomirabilota bacterium]|nr:hypothetical protein [Methylomirabilota bacterium]
MSDDISRRSFLKGTTGSALALYARPAAAFQEPAPLLDPTNADLERLYAELRADTLARHYALGRFFRANHFSTGNFLGQRKSFDCRALWQMTPGVYNSAAGLRQLDPAPQTRERWRIFLHNRENPLMMTGMRLAQLAMEHALGNPGALKIIRLTLRTLGSLYKIKDPRDPFAGFIMRYDECTSDQWTVGFERGKEVPDKCCQFFLDPNPENHPPAGKGGAAYLHCTPLEHPVYKAALERGDGLIKGLFRHHEVSMDELVGLVTGYSTVHTLVTAPDVRAAVRAQVSNLARYLVKFGYLLVRPCGGFTARGSAGVLPALEFPFSRVFRRITGRTFGAPWSSVGRPFDSDTSFVDALKAAGVWLCLEQPVEAAGRAGAAAGLVLLPGWTVAGVLGAAFAAFLADRLKLRDDDARTLLLTIRDALADITGAFGPAAGAGFGYVIFRAIALYDNRRCFDVWDESQQGEFALAYLLKWLSPQQRFTHWMRLKPQGGSSDAFKVFVGLTALDDANTAVRDEYQNWYDRYMANVEPTDEILGPPTDPQAATCMNAAVAALLLGRESDENSVTRQIRRMFGQLTDPDTHRRKPVLGDDTEDKRGIGCGRVEFPYVHESQDKNFNGKTIWIGGYLTSLSFAWFHAQRKRAAGLEPAPGFPELPPPRRFDLWPRSMVPRDVIIAAQRNQLVLPLDALRRGGLPTPIPSNGIDLFVDPPEKPDSPHCGKSAPPLGSVAFRVATPLIGPVVPTPGNRDGHKRVTVTHRQEAPPLTGTRDQYDLVLSDPIRDPATIRDSELLLEAKYEPHDAPNAVSVTVVVEAKWIFPPLPARPVKRNGFFKAKFFLSWVPKQIAVCSG